MGYVNGRGEGRDEGGQGRRRKTARVILAGRGGFKPPYIWMRAARALLGLLDWITWICANWLKRRTRNAAWRSRQLRARTHIQTHCVVGCKVRFSVWSPSDESASRRRYCPWETAPRNYTRRDQIAFLLLRPFIRFHTHTRTLMHLAIVVILIRYLLCLLFRAREDQINL